MYAILSVVGWVWTAIVGIYLVARLKHGQQQQQHEKQL
jgi:hypothetical protein